MANLIAKTNTVPTSYVDVVVTTSPKTLFMIGTGMAEFEIAVTGSDAGVYTLATVTSDDLKRRGVLGTPGTYKVRMTAVSGGPAGLDVL